MTRMDGALLNEGGGQQATLCRVLSRKHFLSCAPGAIRFYTMDMIRFLKRRRFWMALLGLLLIGFLAGLRWWRGPYAETEVLVRRDFVQTVVASGRVENPHRVDIGAQVTGTVARIPVTEGQSVRRNDVLIVLADEELKAAQQQADAAVAQAQAKLRQLQEVQTPLAEQSLRQAQVSLDNARATLQRNEDLFGKGFIGQAALDDSRKVVELADAQWRSARKQWESTQTTGSDYALAHTAIAQARASADAAHARAAYAVIRAPADGVLIGRNVEVGDVVQAGKVLMTLSPHGQPQLVLAIDERNLRLIARGQKALASADAYPQDKFAAEVAYINPAVNAQTAAVEVKLDVPQAPEMLRQDMTVSVDIEVARKTKALVLPSTVVHDMDSPSPWVLSVSQGVVRKTAVRLGLRSPGWVELVEGLHEGDRVVSGPVKVQPGARVRTSASGF